MRAVIFYVVASLCLFVSQINAQTFRERAESISDNIEEITKQEKDSLKMEVDRVNARLETGDISDEEAKQLKQKYAEKRAANIESRIAVEEEKLTQLVKDKVDGKITEGDIKYIEINFGKHKVDTTDANHKYKRHEYKRTTSQFVFAIGANRIVADGEIDDDGFKGRSEFYEWGVSWNTRLFRDNNLLHFKYGASLQYNNLRPDNNKIFATEDGKTFLVDSDKDIDMARLRYVNLVMPVHLELDFTKKRTTEDKVYYPTHESFRIGFGGYVGINVKEKQILKYNEDGHKVRHKEKGDFNVNDFVYGVSAYIGYGQVSLYAKYDLQPLFSDNDVDHNNLSMGVRFDFN